MPMHHLYPDRDCDLPSRPTVIWVSPENMYTWHASGLAPMPSPYHHHHDGRPPRPLFAFSMTMDEVVVSFFGGMARANTYLIGVFIS